MDYRWLVEEDGEAIITHEGSRCYVLVRHGRAMVRSFIVVVGDDHPEVPPADGSNLPGLDL